MIYNKGISAKKYAHPTVFTWVERKVLMSDLVFITVRYREMVRCKKWYKEKFITETF